MFSSVIVKCLLANCEPSKISELLYTLDTVVAEFADNNVFKEATADDEKLATKALKSLDRIIALSQQISLGVRKISNAP